MKGAGRGVSWRDGPAACVLASRAQTAIMVKKLLHTRMRVNDIERTVKFYEQALELRVARRSISPRGAQIVNVARGEVIVEAAMEAALASGQLGGAFLDVFEHEPLHADSTLWRHPNVIVTPHSAGQSAGHATRVATIFSNNLKRWLNGRPLQHAIP